MAAHSTVDTNRTPLLGRSTVTEPCWTESVPLLTFTTHVVPLTSCMYGIEALNV